MPKEDKFQGIIKSVRIDKFRKIKELEFELGKKVTAIAGQNGTMKTTILGMLGQPFSMRSEDNPMSTAKTIDGYKFESKLSNKFRFSKDYDKPGDHKWALYFIDNTICPNKYFEVESIPRIEKSKPEDIRFWNSKGRLKGDGYVQCPIIYLSLRRLSPVGEELSLSIQDNILSPDELEIYKDYHNKILLLQEEIETAKYINAKNKKTLGPKTQKYDAETISAGQDNIGKILLSVLSFKRLKEQYPLYYKGGILLIDELDATLFPKAQEKLVESLFKFSSDYKIQIIFTTHSFSVIKKLFSSKYINDSKLIYLRNGDGSIMLNDKSSLEQIEADLNVKVMENPKRTDKIRVYCEDEEARSFLRNILPYTYRKLLQIVNVNIGCDQLIALCKDRKIPEFTDNLIILDGDKTTNAKNIVTLPGKGLPPDKLMYKYLINLQEKDEFWPGYKTMGLYNKQICFSDYPNLDFDEPGARNNFKMWFNDQKSNWGRDCSKLFSRWKEDNKTEVNVFIESFVKSYNYLAKKSNIETI